MNLLGFIDVLAKTKLSGSEASPVWLLRPVASILTMNCAERLGGSPGQRNFSIHFKED